MGNTHSGKHGNRWKNREIWVFPGKFSSMPQLFLFSASSSRLSCPHRYLADLSRSSRACPDLWSVFHLLDDLPLPDWRASSSHLGHPRVTVARQSDSALFTLGLILAKSTPLATRRKVANHSPWTPRGKQTSSKDIWNRDFHSSPIHSHTCIEVTSGTLALDDLDSCQIRVLK
jgi:hypothetical protein